MSMEAYQAANKQAQKAYRAAMNKGEYPYLSALDDFLPYERTAGEKYIGVIEIPLHLVAGTKTAGRRNSFANNFMPLLSDETEFALKWSGLYDSQLDEGIRDPIVVYEYMHRFYVMEGNKRVSVLKSLQAVKISAKVTRIIPKKTDDLENRIYYEFMDFYDDAKIYDIWFSKEGSYAKLSKSYGYDPGQMWTDESRTALRSEYLSFRKIYKAKGGDKIPITSGDAFLAYIELFPAWQLQSGSEEEIKSNLTKMRDEFLTLGQNKPTKIVLEPHQKEKPSSGRAILNRVLGSDARKQLKIAFIFEKSVVNSAWNYAHEMGRMHLEQVFGERVKTSIYEHAEYTNNSEDIIEAAIEDGNQIIFTVPAQLVNASVKAALKHPEIKILNCSTNSKYQAIRTYYCRMYESKFLLGVIAGALSETNEIGYLADYPIYSTIANINAFALGAQMVNPRVNIHLRWGSMRDELRTALPEDVHVIFDKDWINPKNPTRKYGLYRQLGDGRVENIATSICHWGKVYELIIRSIMENTWKEEVEKNKNRALNYWWGISSGVLEIVCSQKLPGGTKFLVDLLTEMMRRREFSPFQLTWTRQDGTVTNEAGKRLEPEEIFKMNYLAGNVIGGIPQLGELKEEVKEFVRLQGGILMKILLLADVECKALWDFYRKEELEGVGLILSCGDLNAEYLSFLATMSSAPVLYVHGNHDAKYKSRAPEGCICIDDCVYQYKGIRILGLGGSMRYKDDDWQFTEDEMRARVRKLRFPIWRSKGFDILLTHAPAKGLHDGEDLPHHGFQVFHDLMDKYQPGYFIHGHVHMNYGRDHVREDERGKTRVINAFERYVIEVP